MNSNRPFIRSIPVLLILLPATTIVTAQNVVKFGNSYVNLSKKTAGGTVEQGDTLEIRTNYFFPPNYNSGNIYYVRYVDNIPTNTTYAGVGDALRLITNEGLLYKLWTNATGDDPACYKAVLGAGEYNIRMNIGAGAGNVTTTTIAPTGGGNVKPGTHRPRVASGTLITTAFKVKVTGAIGDTIVLGAGQLRFRTTNSISAGVPDVIVNAIPYKILISQNSPICADAVGRNFVAEAGGTFDSGSTQNRSYGASFPIPSYTPRNLGVGNEINDGYYTIVNNLSPRASVFQNSLKRPNCGSVVLPNPSACDNRMFSGHWDIIGDHTGSSTPAGNTPKAIGTRGGYMLVVNADYATSEAYRQTINGLCPNTSYEFSLWVRNVCTNCGIDSTGTQTWKQGVYPNLTFAVDGLDRYSSGQVDTVGWMKKGFMFKTGPTQTGIVISIRNNASGGGGNDWAIDDIALVTCNPNLTMLPSATTTVCAGDQVNISCRVRSFFDNYTSWTWERSTDGGTTWVNTGYSNTSTALPTGNGEYEYEAFYPTFLAGVAANGHMYRFKVASTTGNLSQADCSFLNMTRIVVNVDNCVVLNTKLLSFQGKLVNNFANLQWTTKNETANTVYDIERSEDGSHFSKAGTLNGQPVAGSGSYQFTDNVAVTGALYYRLKLTEGDKHNYSKVVLVSNRMEFTIRSLINPFRNTLSFELVSPDAGTANLSLTDMYGRTIRRSKEPVSRGLNSLRIQQLEGLSSGTYTLRIQLNEKIINRQVVKM